MKNLLPLTLLAMLTLSGCVIHVGSDDHDDQSWESVQRANERAIRSLEIGRSIDSVRAEMGTPDFVEAFERDGDRFTVLFYRTQRMKGDGRTTKDETTPLVFVDSLLVGWGDSAIDHATRSHAQ